MAEHTIDDAHRDEVEEWVEMPPENYTEYMRWQERHPPTREDYYGGMLYDDPFIGSNN